MACSTIANLTIDTCAPSLGGIRTVYLANWKEDAATISGEVVTGFASDVKWYEYPFRKNTGSMTSTLNISEDGAVSVATVLHLVFGKMDTDKRVAMTALASADVMAVVVDSNGERHFLGKDNPVNCSAGTGETGTNRTDSNRYTVDLTDDSLGYPYLLAASVQLALAE